MVAVLFAGIRLGAQIGLQITTNIPRELGGGILALIILFVAARSLYTDLLAWVARITGRGAAPRKEAA
jgi:simple sugar transport system permease protein